MCIMGNLQIIRGRVLDGWGNAMEVLYWAIGKMESKLNLVSSLIIHNYIVTNERYFSIISLIILL